MGAQYNIKLILWLTSGVNVTYFFVVHLKEYNFGKLSEDEFLDISTPYDLISVMQYPGDIFTKGKDATLTYLNSSNATKVPIQAQRVGLSSMDVYEICKRYNCGTCAQQAVKSYEGESYKRLMKKCKASTNRYYWRSRCHNQFFECDLGDDELYSNEFCEPCE